MKLAFLLLLLSALLLALAAPLGLPNSADSAQAPLGRFDRDTFTARYGTGFAGTPGLPLVRGPGGSGGGRPQTLVDVEAELARLGLGHLSLRNWVTDADHGAVARQYARLRALTPASSCRRKAAALACLVALRDAPPRALVWAFEWEIFYSQYRALATPADARTRELVEYYYDRVARLTAHSTIAARAHAVAQLVALSPHPDPGVVRALERSMPKDLNAYYWTAVERLQPPVLAIRECWARAQAKLASLAPYFSVAPHSVAIKQRVAALWA